MQVLAVEMFKTDKKLSPDILNEIFLTKAITYDFRNKNNFERRKVISLFNGNESFLFLGPKVPSELKELESLDIFKKKLCL